MATTAAAPPDFADPNSAEGLELLCAANHPAEPVDWLWHNRIPVGKVTLIAGDPGLGKSLVALDVAARVTRGLAFPDDLPPSPLPPSPGSVLILSASDDLADTIRPRLDACGADPSRVFVLPSITDLRHDFGQLKAAVDRVPNCRLIIVDPVNAFVGPSDSHFHTVVRRVLTPLTRLAAEKRIAVLAITQFRKNDGAAIHRAAGSTGFVATARSLWTVGRDPRDAGRNLLLPLKQNLTATACGLAFRIADDSASQAPRIIWEPEVPLLSTEEAFARPKKPPLPSPDRLAARDWLRKTLAAGPRPARLILDEGEQHGFHTRTLQRAFHELAGHTAKRGLLQGWWWSLDDESDQPSETAESITNRPQPPQNFPVPFEDVTYQEDLNNQAELDTFLGEHHVALLQPPTLADSITALERARPRPPSPTGHRALDLLLESFRANSPNSRSKLSPNSAPPASRVQWDRRRKNLAASLATREKTTTHHPAREPVA